LPQIPGKLVRKTSTPVHKFMKPALAAGFALE